MELDSLDSMCMTWRHDFGVSGEHRQKYTRDELRPLYIHHVQPLSRKVKLLAKASRYGAAAFKLHKWCFNQLFKEIDHSTATADLGVIYYEHLAHAQKMEMKAQKFYREAMTNAD